MEDNQPKSTIRIKREQYDQLVEVAIEEGRPVEELVHEALTDYCREQAEGRV